MSTPTHPGTITYVDTQKGTEWSEPAENAPIQVRFHDGVPVVRVVMSGDGHHVMIREFGPDGQLLRSTTGFE